MTNYTKTVDFAAKDGLASGNVAKRILGTEINTEFTNIQTAVNSKLDSASFTASSLSGVVATANGGTGSSSTTYCNLTTNVAGTLPVANGGTGLFTLGAANAILVSTSSTAMTTLASSNTSALVTNASGALSYTAGTSANTVLRSNGTSITFGPVNLLTDVSDQLPVASGGTGGADAATARDNLDVPARDGTDASGTWAIDISGNADTATTANTALSVAASNITGAVAIANGGSGATTATGAAQNLLVPGFSQTWQSTIGSRVINTNYQNTTGRPISVAVTLTNVTAGANNPTFWVSTGTPATGGTVVAQFQNGTTGNIDATLGPVLVPPNHYYQVQAAIGTLVVYWAELR